MSKFSRHNIDCILFQNLALKRQFYSKTIATKSTYCATEETIWPIYKSFDKCSESIRVFIKKIHEFNQINGQIICRHFSFYIHSMTRQLICLLCNFCLSVHFLRPSKLDCFYLCILYINLSRLIRHKINVQIFQLKFIITCVHVYLWINKRFTVDFIKWISINLLFSNLCMLHFTKQNCTCKKRKR